MVRIVSPARNEEHAWRREEEMVFEPNRRDVPEASPEVSAAAVAAEDMIQFEFWLGLCSFLVSFVCFVLGSLRVARAQKIYKPIDMQICSKCNTEAAISDFNSFTGEQKTALWASSAEEQAEE